MFVLVYRPEDGVHPPAAGLDPQLPSGGAEVHVAAGGLGQDVSATLSQQETPPPLTQTVYIDQGWAQEFITTMLEICPLLRRGNRSGSALAEALKVVTQA